MHENTYKSLVEANILLHNVIVVDNCDIPLVLYLIRNLLVLVLHLCSLLDILLVHYTDVPICTVLYCTEVASYCTVAVWYYMVVA